MSTQSSNDEIDLIDIFKMIKKGFRNFFKAIISLISFYKRRRILFLILLVVGFGIGFFVDQNRDAKDEYSQEIIIEPKYNSVKYIYDFIEELEKNFKDYAFLDKLKIKPEHIVNLSEITIEPIVKGTDVLDNLEERYKEDEFFEDIMKAYDANQVEEEKFRDFYKHHRISFKFKSKKDYNAKISFSILEYIKSNNYYKSLSELAVKQKKTDIERNKKSLEFIDAYLKNIEKSPLKVENEAVVISTETEIPMVSIASLLQKKELLMQLINDQEKAVIFDKEMFYYVDYGEIISKRKILLNRAMFTIPLLLTGLVSLFFFLRYLSKRINEFVNEE